MKAPNLIRNIFANFLGRGWTSLIGLVFVPLYIRFLGVEAYGLIGIYASLVALLNVLDMGLSATLSRELARLSATPGNEQEARDLVRTMELVYWGIGAAIGAIIFAGSWAIARHWIHSEGIPPEAIRRAVMLMGTVAALEWPGALYSGGLMGLERQVELNAVKAGAATMQAAGAILVLWLVSPTIHAFFAWQAVIVAIQTLVLAGALRRALPRAPGSPKFRGDLLRKHRRFAAGMTGIALLATVLTQLDKIVLTKLVSLESFAYYALAASVASVLPMMVQPVHAAVFPRFAQLAATGEARGEASLYHRACQLAAVLVLPVAATLIAFSREILELWLRDPVTADRTHLLLSVLVVGSTFNAIVTIPYVLQVAHGWTRLSVVKNMIAVSIAVPLLLLLVGRIGALGAAIVWAALNAGYVAFEVPYMHRRLLRGELARWYFLDNVRPVVAATAICLIARGVMPGTLPSSGTALWIAGSWFACTFVSAAALGMLAPQRLRSYARSLVGDQT